MALLVFLPAAELLAQGGPPCNPSAAVMHLHHQAAAGQAVIMQPHPHHPPQVWSVIKKLLLFWSLSLKVQGLFVRLHLDLRNALAGERWGSGRLL